MKIALLVCDHVPVDLQNEHGSYPGMFGNLLNVPMDTYYVCDGHFPEIQDYDAFITTGSKFSVYDDVPWINRLKDFTRNIFQARKKMIGVCFGHQMIAEALGGKVKRSDSGFLIGIHSFQIRKRPDWMEPFESSYRVLMLCQDQVTDLPGESKIVADSAECPVGMFTVGNHFLGIQGHPEFTPAYNRALFEKRLKGEHSEKVHRAIQSFQHKPHRNKLAGYMLRFLGMDASHHKSSK